MAVFLYIKQILDAFDGNIYAICILVLFLLLIFNYLKRVFFQESRKELSEELEMIKEQLKKTENESGKKDIEIEQLVKTKNLLSNSNKELNIAISEYQEKYSALYKELSESNTKSKVFEQQLLAYRLSPHLLKNLLNKTFLENKIDFDFNKIEPSFRFFGQNFFSTKRLEKSISKFNNNLSESLTLIIDILNYLTYGIMVDNIHIDTEITHLIKFCKLIELNKGIKIEIDNRLYQSSLYIPPSLLFNFVDNALKHGYFGSDKQMKISLSYTNKLFEYKVMTPIHPEMNSKKILGGIGDSDFEKSLKLTKKDAFNISNEIINNTYIAKLQMTI